MAEGIIYQVGSDDNLTRMLPGKPVSEAQIQELIAKHPEIVTGTDERLLLIRREQPIPDSSFGSGRWSLDHLFVTRDAKPVLVEVKQASNTKLRREVIGQLLEYAANAVSHWGRGRMAESFYRRFENEEDALLELDSFLADPSANDAGGGAGDREGPVSDRWLSACASCSLQLLVRHGMIDSSGV